MISEESKKRINKITDLSQRNKYLHITKNCDMYMVKPNGNKLWLCDNMVLLEWDYCEHPNPFESWKLPNAEQAKEYFLNIKTDENDY